MPTSEEKVVAVDLGTTQLLQNKIFDPKQPAKISHVLLLICFLYEQAKN